MHGYTDHAGKRSERTDITTGGCTATWTTKGSVRSEQTRFEGEPLGGRVALVPKVNLPGSCFHVTRILHECPRLGCVPIDTLIRKANAPIIRTQSLKPLLRRFLLCLSRNMHQKEYIPDANITQILQNFPSLRNTTDNRNLTQSSQGKHFVNFPHGTQKFNTQVKEAIKKNLGQNCQGCRSHTVPA